MGLLAPCLLKRIPFTRGYLSPDLTHSTVEGDLALRQTMPPWFFPQRTHDGFPQLLQRGAGSQRGQQIDLMFTQETGTQDAILCQTGACDMQRKMARSPMK